MLFPSTSNTISVIGLKFVAIMESASASIPGWFLEAEGLWYREAVASKPQGLIVEIGCWLGRSTSFLAPVLSHKPRRLVCVDHFRGSTDQWNQNYLRDIDLANQRGLSIRSQFESNMNTLEIPYQLLAMSSSEASFIIEDSSATVVFLDGSHDGDAIADDLRRWLPKVSHGGILAGHDYGVEAPEVMREVHRFSEEKQLPVLRGPGTIFYFEVSPEKYQFSFEEV